MDPPGRVNNLYKEKLVVEPTYEITPIVNEKSQGCNFARTAGYGTLEYCTQPSDALNVPPRYFQLDENVRVQNNRLAIKSIDYTQIGILLLVIFLIFYFTKR